MDEVCRVPNDRGWVPQRRVEVQGGKDRRSDVDIIEECEPNAGKLGSTPALIIDQEAFWRMHIADIVMI
jgi:hypothetical protein